MNVLTGKTKNFEKIISAAVINTLKNIKYTVRLFLKFLDIYVEHFKRYFTKLTMKEVTVICKKVVGI